jgi:hypothetical protein
VTAPRGPFPPEILAETRITHDYARQDDSGGQDLPLGSTAQNDFKPTRWFSCNDCKVIVSEAQLETHTCGD